MNAATAAAKEKHTVTLAGTFGTATISGITGITFPSVLTFDTDLATTAANFVTAYEAEYLAAGVVLTASTNTLIFEAGTAGVPTGTPVITNATSNIAGTVAHSVANVTGLKQKETVTIAGEGGILTINLSGVEYSIPFDTDLATTAAAFATAHAAVILAAYAAVVTSDSATVIFEASTAGVPIPVPVVPDRTGDLAGTVDHTTANVVAVKQVALITLSGTSGIAHMEGTGGLVSEVVFDTSLLVTAQNFVTNYADAYLEEGVVVTAGVLNTIIFTAETAGVPFFAPFCTNQLGDLAGVPTASQVNVVAVAQVETITVEGTGFATIGAAGGLTKSLSVTGLIPDGLVTFVEDNAADYLEQAIILTSDGADLIFTAETPGTSFTAPTITNVVGMSGTVAHTTANRAPVKQVEIITATGTFGQATIAAAGGLTKVLDATTSIADGWKAFKAANLALYDAQGIIILENGSTLTMTAKTAGTGFTAPTITVRANLTGTDAVTLANTSLLPLTFSGLATEAGGGGIIYKATAESDMTAMAATVLRLWLFNAIPSGIVADNAAYVTAYANSSKLLGYIDITFDAAGGSSDAVFGQARVVDEYVCASDDVDIYVIPQTVTGFTPTSGGKLRITLDVVKMA